MFSSSVSSGSCGATVGIGIVAIVDGMVVGFIVFLNLIVLFVVRFVLVFLASLVFLCILGLVQLKMLV